MVYFLIMILRRLPNFAVIDEYVMAQAVNASIVVISFWAATVKCLSFGEPPLNYYMCAGIDPNQQNGIGYYQNQVKKYNTSIIIWVASLLLHIVLGIQIFVFERKTEKKDRPLALGGFAQRGDAPAAVNNTSTVTCQVFTICGNDRSLPKSRSPRYISNPYQGFIFRV